MGRSCLVWALVLAGSAAAGDVVYPTGSVADPELKNLAWNRYTAQDFTILSIENNQGRWLHDNIGKIKTWGITRWGLPDFRFPAECRVFCVPDRALFKKLFALDGPQAERRQVDEVVNGVATGRKIDIVAVWLVLDDRPAASVSPTLAGACLTEFELKYNTSLALWAKHGMAALNAPPDMVRRQVGEFAGQIAADRPMFLAEKLMAMTAEEYAKLAPEYRQTFDRQSLAACLLLRKEFGQVKFLSFLRAGGQLEGLRSVYRYGTYQQFDRSLLRYMKDLTASRPPDSYLDIQPVK